MLPISSLTLITTSLRPIHLTFTLTWNCLTPSLTQLKTPKTNHSRLSNAQCPNTNTTLRWLRLKNKQRSVPFSSDHARKITFLQTQHTYTRSTRYSQTNLHRASHQYFTPRLCRFHISPTQNLGLYPPFSERTHTVNISAVDFHTSLDHSPSLTHCRLLNRMRPASIQANFATNVFSHDVCISPAHKSDKSHWQQSYLIAYAVR